MFATRFDAPARLVIGVNAPGGTARQFRVQVYDATHSEWRLHAVFRQAGEADQCAETLHAAGVPARVVRYGCCAAGV